MFETIKERWYDILFSKIGSYVFNELWKYFKFTILLCSKALSFEILSNFYILNIFLEALLVSILRTDLYFVLSIIITLLFII